MARTNFGRLRDLSLRSISGDAAVVSLFAIACALSILARPANAQTFSVIHSFTGGVDGSVPFAGVTLHGGLLYGTTTYSGSNEHGTVYQIAQVGSNWITRPIFVFPGDGSGGAYPQARVLFGPDGHLYGTTNGGGKYNGGVVFSLTPQLSICKTAACFWTEKTLHSFMGNPDGLGPQFGDLIWDPMGNIYGTTAYGGLSDFGTVYELQPSGNGWAESVLYSFSGPDGEYPAAGVTLDSSGNIFGAAPMGGLYGFGNIFELTYTPGSGWEETVLYSFQNSGDGEYPLGGLIFDKSGNLYGVSIEGGSGGGGTVFELSPAGNTWTFKLLYSFLGAPNCGVYAPLTMDAAGNLYGTTFCDGANSWGQIFKLTNTGNDWVYTPLHQFTGGKDGAFPIGGVTLDAGGSLYGTTTAGGSTNFGTVWMIKP